MKPKILLFLFCFLLIRVFAQHPMDMPMPGDTAMQSCSAFSLNLPMSRNGSGTSWLPDNSPQYGYMFHHSAWSMMLQGNFFLRYDHQDLTGKGHRGGEMWDAPDWFMLMAQRQVKTNGLFHCGVMLSFEDLVTGPSGYPLLFQTGEAAHGRPLVDRQHPHELFSGLWIGYSQALSKKSDLFFYVGYPGEPALGSPAYLHRPSASPDPDAPITHHWNDATHITFGVATIGYRYSIFKLEVSSFTGREPDEHRLDFETPLFDSWSTRLSCNPNRNWALQVSHAFLNKPERMFPEENIRRTTFSAVYSNMLNGMDALNVTLLWGLNYHPGLYENAFLAEVACTHLVWTLYSRYEWVQKSATELGLAENGSKPHVLFPVCELTTGIAYAILQNKKVNIDAGGQFAFYFADSRLDPWYGDRPVSLEIYLRVYPPRL